MTAHADDLSATVHHKRECHYASIDMTGYDYTTARHGDSRNPRPMHERDEFETADMRGSMYWGTRY